MSKPTITVENLKVAREGLLQRIANNQRTILDNVAMRSYASIINRLIFLEETKQRRNSKPNPIINALNSLEDLGLEDLKELHGNLGKLHNYINSMIVERMLINDQNIKD